MIDYIAIPEERMKILKKNEKWIKKLEELTNAKIKMNEEIKIEGNDFLQIMRIKEVLKAFGRGFGFNIALNLLDEEYYLEVINLKEYTKSRNRMVVLKGRVIGTKGKMKKIIERETNTKIAIYGKTISIIGKFENLRIAEKVIRMILEGKKHGTVLRFLEEKRVK